MPFTTQQFQKYLDRIHYPHNRQNITVSIETLQALHEAHVNHIPFENLDIMLNKPIKIDQESLYDKLVIKQRGGYCYEMNELFALALEHVGFCVHRLLSRVLFPETRTLSHKILLIEFKNPNGSEFWLADTGFSGNSLRHPILLPKPGQSTEAQQHEEFKILTRKTKFNNEEYILQVKIKNNWANLFSFSLVETLPSDFEILNHSLSTKDDSPFVKQRICAKPISNGRMILIDNKLKVRTKDGITESILTNEEYIELLAKEFNIKLQHQENLALLKEVLTPKMTFF